MKRKHIIIAGVWLAMTACSTNSQQVTVQESVSSPVALQEEVTMPEAKPDVRELPGSGLTGTGKVKIEILYQCVILIAILDFDTLSIFFILLQSRSQNQSHHPRNIRE